MSDFARLCCLFANAVFWSTAGVVIPNYMETPEQKTHALPAGGAPAARPETPPFPAVEASSTASAGGGARSTAQRGSVAEDSHIPDCVPRSLLRFCTPKWFLAVLSCFVVLQSMLATGLLSAVISTLEKRYDLSSLQSGMLPSSADFSVVIVATVICVWGSEGNKARWLASVFLLMGFSSLLFGTHAHMLSFLKSRSLGIPR